MFFKSNATPQARPGTTAGGRSAIPSLLSADICIKGDVRSSGEIQVDGVVEGDIVAQCLVVSEAGTVGGTIVARTARILGTVTGTITAGSIKLARTARVTGDIVHEALSIEEGAFVLGHCRRAEPDQPGQPGEPEVMVTTAGPSFALPADRDPVVPETQAVPDGDDSATGEDATAEEELTIPSLAR